MTDMNITLAEARANLLSVMYDEGAECPCCTQNVKVWRRKVNSAMAAALISQFRAAGTDFVHTRDLWLPYTKEGAQMRWWGLIEAAGDRREDGGHSGWWRVTPFGRKYITANATILKYAYVFDGVVLEYDGPEVTIHDALGDKFDLQDLWAGR